MTKNQFDEIAEKDPDLLEFITELVAARLDSRRPTAYRTIGKYVATDIIGRGAFSIVYKGRHTGLNMPVVIKMMRHDMALYPDFMESLRSEAKTIACLTHDHIVRVYDFEERYRTLNTILNMDTNLEARGRALVNVGLDASGKDIMTSPAFTVFEVTQVFEIATMFAEKNINRVPVVDQNGLLMGLVARADIFQATCTL